MLKVYLILTILFHYIIFVAFGVFAIKGLFVLYWWEYLILGTFVVRLLHSPNICPLTKLENYYRRRLGLKMSRSFLQDYVLNIEDTIWYLYINLGK